MCFCSTGTKMFDSIGSTVGLEPSSFYCLSYFLCFSLSCFVVLPRSSFHQVLAPSACQRDVSLNACTICCVIRHNIFAIFPFGVVLRFLLWWSCSLLWQSFHPDTGLLRCNSGALLAFIWAAGTKWDPNHLPMHLERHWLVSNSSVCLSVHYFLVNYRFWQKKRETEFRQAEGDCFPYAGN